MEKMAKCRRVTFNESGECMAICGDRLMKKDRKALWYRQSDIDSFKRDVRSTLLELKQFGGRGDNNELDEDMYCLRGLERFLDSTDSSIFSESSFSDDSTDSSRSSGDEEDCSSSCSKRRMLFLQQRHQAIRKKFVRKILELQTEQQLLGKKDASSLALLATRASQKSSSRARLLAAKDASSALCVYETIFSSHLS